MAVLSTATRRWSRRGREVLLGKQDLPKSATAPMSTGKCGFAGQRGIRSGHCCPVKLNFLSFRSSWRLADAVIRRSQTEQYSLNHTGIFAGSHSFHSKDSSGQLNMTLPSIVLQGACRDSQDGRHRNPPLKRWAILDRPCRDESQRAQLCPRHQWVKTPVQAAFFLNRLANPPQWNVCFLPRY